ncbi:Nucleotide-binding universal stress protein, UspA family [Sphingomonas sp. YR710]|nr:Nucleotide-binding universal stress protein, UspA family [Sphingomonas sp. YR710]
MSAGTGNHHIEPGRATGRVTACIAHPAQADGIVPHAFALAKALDAPVTLLQVLEGERAPARPDPIEWDMRRHEARRSLACLAIPRDPSMGRADIELADGAAVDEIRRVILDHPDGLLVMGLQEQDSSRCRGIGSTVHNLLHAAPSSIMLVPALAAEAPLNGYRRILVPVDGSPWAASALPLAVRLAKQSGAQLVLAHVIPSPEFTETGPFDTADLTLRQSVLDRNIRTARIYLDQLHRAVADLDISVRTVVAQGDDVRSTLEQLIRTEAADLVILSARGHGLLANTEMSYGSVAGYLMTHATVPLLVVPTAFNSDHSAVLQHPQDLRLPMFASA